MIRWMSNWGVFIQHLPFSHVQCRSSRPERRQLYILVKTFCHCDGFDPSIGRALVVRVAWAFPPESPELSLIAASEVMIPIVTVVVVVVLELRKTPCV